MVRMTGHSISAQNITKKRKEVSEDLLEKKKALEKAITESVQLGTPMKAGIKKKRKVAR